MISQFFPASNAYAAASVLGVAAADDRSVRWTRRVRVASRSSSMTSSPRSLPKCRCRSTQRRRIHHAWKADHRDSGWDPTLGALPKVFASEVSWKVVTKALELHGAQNTCATSGSKLVRDAACFVHSDGVNRTLLLKAAQFIRSRS